MAVRTTLLRFLERTWLGHQLIDPGTYAFSRVWSDRPPCALRYGLLAPETADGYGEFVVLAPADVGTLLRAENVAFDAGVLLTTEDRPLSH